VNAIIRERPEPGARRVVTVSRKRIVGAVVAIADARGLDAVPLNGPEPELDRDVLTYLARATSTGDRPTLVRIFAELEPIPAEELFATGLERVLDGVAAQTGSGQTGSGQTGSAQTGSAQTSPG
jgi:hypothetical protein